MSKNCTQPFAPVHKAPYFQMRNFMTCLQLFLGLWAWSMLISCQSSSNNTKFGNALITADIRYLMTNGELSGTWSFYQRNQVDSLVPDARLHEFIINGQKIVSDKVENNYHMYMVGDTLISQNLNVQIQPDNEVISIAIPLIPQVQSDRLQTGQEWNFSWNRRMFEAEDSITLVLSDSLQQTILTKSHAQAGKLTIPARQTQNLTSGPGFYYLISRENRSKVVNKVDFEYSIEVYSEDYPVEISMAMEEE